MRTIKWAWVLALALAAFACAKEAPDSQAVNFLYYGGTIVTHGEGAARVEAIAVENGRVVDMGTFKDMHDTHAGAMTRMIDLKDGVMLAGDVDATQAADVGAVLSKLTKEAAGHATIAVGEPANFVVFNRNPLASHDTAGLRVTKIVRDGEIVYREQE